MAQSKKASVRAAILDAAFKLFSEKWYAAATVPQIAAGAGISPANVYVYFRSKLEIIFAIYEPWLRQQLDELEREANTIVEPDLRLRRILIALWREIPAANNGFTNNVMQAVAQATPGEGYESKLIRWAEAKVAALLERVFRDSDIPVTDAANLAHIILMSFDGFSINFHLNQWAACSDALVEDFCRLLLRPPNAPPRSGRAPKRMR